MLSQPHRLRHATQFAAVLRRGQRARRGSLVVHVLPSDTAAPAQVGLIVGKTVGGSVVRHRVSRRIRAQVAQRLDALPTGAQVVVRALPDAAEARSAAIGRDLDAALGRLLPSFAESKSAP